MNLEERNRLIARYGAQYPPQPDWYPAKPGQLENWIAIQTLFALDDLATAIRETREGGRGE